MSVDREYTVRIPIDAENSGVRQTAQDVKETGAIEKNAGEELRVFETHGGELYALIGELNNFLAETAVLLRAAFDPQNTGAIEIPSATKSTQASIQPTTPPGLPTNRVVTKPSEEEPTAAVKQAVAPDDNGSRQYVEPDTTITHTAARQAGESIIDAQTRTDLMNQARSLQIVAPSRGVGLTQQEAAELAELMRQLGRAFFERSDNNVSKQEFEREKIALRRLIESKGK